MAGVAGSFANLALWLHLRRNRPASGAAAPALAPPGAGPLLVIHLSSEADDPPALTPIIAGLRQARSDLRILMVGGASDAACGPLCARAGAQWGQQVSAAEMADLRPSALLLLGDALPAALISAASAAQVPMILAETRLDGTSRQKHWSRSRRRALLSRIDHILMPDPQAAKTARALGARHTRIEVIGPVTDTRPPLRGNEAERRAMAQLLRDRHLWLAAAPSHDEAVAALHAHQQFLQYSHRAMLILAAPPPGSLATLQQLAEQLGMATILRSDDDDPTADDQVLIAEEDDEMGLWYRLAPVCFMGRTLFEGDGATPRHPFEAAALGSAIIHGPLPGLYGDEWAQLDGALAARRIDDLADLTRAIEDLSAADQAATLACNAWAVSTGGAAVVRRISATVLAAIEGPK